MHMQPLSVTAWTLTSALGAGRAATLEALKSRHSGLRPCDLPHSPHDCWIGRVPGLETRVLSEPYAAFDCRNNRLAEIALTQDDFPAACARAAARYGTATVGVFLGTSTSGIAQTERAYRERQTDASPLPPWYDYRHTHDLYSLTRYVRTRLGLAGPALAVSTACSSSAKVFATAARHIEAGLCRAAVVGGVDSLCLMTLYGFCSLQLVSPEPCRPTDPERDGISLGEAGGFALLEPLSGDTALTLLGCGESSDAYHMSAPHPGGAGAGRAMRRALMDADLAPGAIDWVHLHGTATPANDLAEDRALESIFGPGMAASSTKGWTGHTLGAAGIVSFAMAALALEEGFLPGTINTRRPDPAFSADVLLENRPLAPRRVVLNALGFGGNNASLVIGHTDRMG